MALQLYKIHCLPTTTKYRDHQYSFQIVAEHHLEAETNGKKYIEEKLADYWEFDNCNWDIAVKDLILGAIID